jgi:hypothetical protein
MSLSLDILLLVVMTWLLREPAGPDLGRHWFASSFRVVDERRHEVISQDKQTRDETNSKRLHMHR